MKIALRIVAGLFLVVTAACTYVALRPMPTFPETPMPAISASADPAVIEHGRYVVYNVAHCANCHAAPDALAKHSFGAPGDLRGGKTFDGGPFGTFTTANLTPDPDTGLGRLSDGQVARAIRTGVLHDGQLGMTMRVAPGDMSDADLVAVVSYLRSIPPVKNAVPRDDLGLLAHAMSGLFSPRATNAPPDAPSPSAARGKYITEGPANCVGCHTKRDPMKAFALAAPPFSGGDPTPDFDAPDFEYLPPNLTPDPTTGRITTWTEDQFVQRFRAGRAFGGSPMPWESFGGLTDDDLRSIYRHLHALPPTQNDPGPSRRAKGWKPGDPT